MSEPEPGSISQAFQQLQQGDAAAAAALWERYFPRLLGLARKTLAGRPQRVADEEDVAQCAFASFVRRVQEGSFGAGLNRDDVWSLLGVFAVRKAKKQVRRENAAKRGEGRVIDEAGLAARNEDLGLDSFADVPVGHFDLHCEELLGQLEDELRTIAVLRMLGHTNREIAEQLRCTERRIERKLAVIRERWEAAFPE